MMVADDLGSTASGSLRLSRMDRGRGRMDEGGQGVQESARSEYIDVCGKLASEGVVAADCCPPPLLSSTLLHSDLLTQFIVRIEAHSTTTSIAEGGGARRKGRKAKEAMRVYPWARTSPQQLCSQGRSMTSPALLPAGAPRGVAKAQLRAGTARRPQMTPTAVLFGNGGL